MVEAAVTPTATLLGRIAATQNCEWLRHSVAIARYRAAPLNQVLGVLLRVLAIVLGLFVLFALAFNGITGSLGVSGAISATALIATGLVPVGTDMMQKVRRATALVGAIFYLPMISSRFSSYGIDWVGLIFDFMYFALIAAIFSDESLVDANYEHTDDA